ncbi:MAG: SAM-dependent methyltransferase [Hormoscilla sp. SP5CHS1]|nr:SAM-dependent methyltransferase [Hormoscilla sp. SP5CHS1]
MGLKLDNVVPWGRSHAEYQRMFDITIPELELKILDCGGGPASFNASMTRRGYNNVISCDPVYQFSAEEIARRIQATYSVIVEGVNANRDKYVWQGSIASPTQLGKVRMAAMQQFLADFTEGKKLGRYVTAELPVLPFDRGQFDLALCSHLLFLYSDQLDAAFHFHAILELCRVAREVRIFPLLDISGEHSPHLSGAIRELRQQGYRVEIRQVDYEFQRGGNQMLRILKMDN